LPLRAIASADDCVGCTKPFTEATRRPATSVAWIAFIVCKFCVQRKRKNTAVGRKIFGACSTLELVAVMNARAELPLHALYFTGGPQQNAGQPPTQGAHLNTALPAATEAAQLSPATAANASDTEDESNLSTADLVKLFKDVRHPVAKLLKELDITVDDAIQLDMIEQLRGLPHKKRITYIKRDTLTEEERKQQARTRNREHAKLTRDRKKFIIEVRRLGFCIVHDGQAMFSSPRVRATVTADVHNLYHSHCLLL
jgi:hypothetical protein